MEETIGARIAQLRQEHGWTQQALADRIAISRVAISHMEMDLTVPGERTVTLLAGVFKLSPQELVADTTYPQAKAERLPQAASRYTELELQLALLENDLAWLERVGDAPAGAQARLDLRAKWLAKLTVWERECLLDRDREKLQAARQALLEAVR